MGSCCGGGAPVVEERELERVRGERRHLRGRAAAVRPVPRPRQLLVLGAVARPEEAARLRAAAASSAAAAAAYAAAALGRERVVEHRVEAAQEGEGGGRGEAEAEGEQERRLHLQQVRPGRAGALQHHRHCAARGRRAEVRRGGT